MNIGLLGYGTVAQAFLKLLDEVDSPHKVISIFRRAGHEGERMTSKIEDIIYHPDIDCVLELMGQIEPTYAYLEAAIKEGKHVITANKALMNLKGEALNQLAIKHQVHLRFSAACGGGIPILPTLLTIQDEAMIEMSGILNGTSNFIIDQMESLSEEFDEALRQAQDLGYAEKDPSSDLSGEDSYYKIRLALAVKEAIWIENASVCIEGIQSLKAQDIRFFTSMGYNLRVLARAYKNGDEWAVVVEPMLVSHDSFEASIHQNNNGITLTSFDNHRVLQGEGAGGKATAKNVLRDCDAIDEGSMLQQKMSQRVAHLENIKQAYWVRTQMKEAWLSHVAQRIEWFEGSVYTLTIPISIKGMHEEVMRYRLKDECFFAGIKETV